MSKDSTALIRPLPVAKYGEHSIRSVEYNGRTGLFAVDVGRASGLAKPEQAIAKIVSDEETDEGIEYVTLTGDALAALKHNPLIAGVVDSNVNQITILLEPGYWRLLAGARTEKGRAFRTWLFREHLPSLHNLAPPPNKVSKPKALPELTPEQQAERAARIAAREAADRRDMAALREHRHYYSRSEVAKRNREGQKRFDAQMDRWHGKPSRTGKN